jgi:hypothetical protein
MKEAQAKPAPAMTIGLALAILASSATAAGDRVQLSIDASEADQVLAILTLRRAGKPVPEAKWQQLFATEPYRRLKEREASIAERFHDSSIILSDEQFRQFVSSDALLKRAPDFEATIARELHHIGLQNALAAYEKRIAALPDLPRATAGNLAAFVLTAVGLWKLGSRKSR